MELNPEDCKNLSPEEFLQKLKALDKNQVERALEEIFSMSETEDDSDDIHALYLLLTCNLLGWPG